MRFIAGLIILLLATGCTAGGLYLLIREKGPKAYQVKIVGERVEPWRINVIYETLTSLTEETIVPKLEIVITDDQTHLGKTWNDKHTAGHHCLCFSPTRICILRQHVVRDTITHEVAHAYHHFLNKAGENFNQEWIRAAGDVYNKDKNAANGQGIVSAYSRINHMEDVAMWFEHCHAYLHNNADNFTFISDCKTDPRYRKKLALLHKYKFLSAEQYDKLKPLFE